MSPTSELHTTTSSPAGKTPTPTSPEVKPDPVEMWLKGLPLASKTKRNIKGILAILWSFAMKKEYVPIGHNPMNLVTIRRLKGEKRRLPMKELSAEQFQLC
jgi:hypothetical protein